MIKDWGPPVWYFLHVFCARIDEKQLMINKKSIFNFLMQIVCNLPCPDCSFHARQYFLKLNFENLHTKNQLIEVIFNFHNDVSARVHNKNPNFKKEGIEILNQYKNSNVKDAFRKYHAEWTKASSIKNVIAMTSTFSRNKFMDDTIKWIKGNLHLFEPDSVV